MYSDNAFNNLNTLGNYVSATNATKSNQFQYLLR